MKCSAPSEFSGWPSKTLALYVGAAYFKRTGRLLALLLSVQLFAAAHAAPVQAKRSKSSAHIFILRTESAALNDAQRKALSMMLVKRIKLYKNYRVSHSKLDLVEDMFEFECTEAGVSCLSKIGAKHRASKVIYSEVTKTGDGKFRLSMRVVQLRTRTEAIARVAQSTSQIYRKVNKPQAAVENGLLVLIGPIDLPEKRTRLPGRLRVQLIGGGVALVYVNKRLAGRTSVSGLRLKLPAGRHQLRVVRAGYDEWRGTVRVRSGKSTRKLVRLAVAKVVPTGPLDGAASKDSITKKWWFWSSIGAAAVGAGVVVYLMTRPKETKKLGNAAFSMDSNDAYLDPIFSGM